MSSSFVITVPHGLFGELSSRARVLGPMAASMAGAVLAQTMNAEHRTDFTRRLLESVSAALAGGAAEKGESPVSVLAEAQRRAIQMALDLTGYNRTQAAKLLDIHRSTLIRKIRLMGIDTPL